MERGAITRAAAMMSSIEMLPLCWMFFTFFLSLGGSFKALMTRGSRGDDGAGGLPVLDLQLHSHLEALPVSSCLGNVISDFLGLQAKGSNLGGKGAGSSDFATDSPQVDILHLSGVKLRSHGSQMQISGSHVCKWWMRAISIFPLPQGCTRHVCSHRQSLEEAPC